MLQGKILQGSEHWSKFNLGNYSERGLYVGERELTLMNTNVCLVLCRAFAHRHCVGSLRSKTQKLTQAVSVKRICL